MTDPVVFYIFDTNFANSASCFFIISGFFSLFNSSASLIFYVNLKYSAYISSIITISEFFNGFKSNFDFNNECIASTSIFANSNYFIFYSASYIASINSA